MSRLDHDPTTEDRSADPHWKECEHGLPEKLSSLREKLYRKAKQEPRFRFYALYDRIYRLDVLMAAWKIVRRNKGAAGVDGVTIQAIAAQDDGPCTLVEHLHHELRTKTYKPQPVLRVHIPKPDGQLRPLGIPTVRDRVVQTAAKLILEPIFEADFKDCSYGFRPGRSAHQAIEEVREHVNRGFRAVLDVDLKGYFDTIPHDKLMACVQMRVTDRSVLALIRAWLRTPVQEDNDDGGTSLRKSDKGTPQGGVISPLLANIYLHWLDHFFHGADGPATWANAKLVRYADDFAILARYISIEMKQWLLRTVEERMGLTINREKSRSIQLEEKDARFDFLGYRYRYRRSRINRQSQYLHLEPAPKSRQRARDRLRELISARMCWKPVHLLITDVNRHLRGWSSYFRLGHPSKVFRDLDTFVEYRLFQHLRRRSQRRVRLPKDRSFFSYLAGNGLVRLEARRATPCARLM